MVKSTFVVFSTLSFRALVLLQHLRNRQNLFKVPHREAHSALLSTHIAQCSQLYRAHFPPPLPLPCLESGLIKPAHRGYERLVTPSHRVLLSRF